MKISKTRVSVAEGGWNQEKPRRAFSIPYNVPEAAAWVFNNLFGPSRRFHELTLPIPTSDRLNAISPKVRLGFLGDILPLRHVDLRVASEIQEFFADVDLIIGNFEGTLVENPPFVFLGQAHKKGIVDFLADLGPPEKIILCCANNHACDYGWNRFESSYQFLQDAGFTTLGRRDEPVILIDDNVSLTNCTRWSNQPCSYITTLEAASEFYNPTAPFNILFPHWGYEMQAFPNPQQIEVGTSLLDRWDMVVGAHSHCTQPVAAYERGDRKRLLAYSLGDFSCGMNLKRFLHGLILKVDLGPDEAGRWLVGDVQWQSTIINLERRQVQLDPLTARIAA